MQKMPDATPSREDDLRRRVADAERVAEEAMNRLMARTKEIKDAGAELQASRSRERKLSEALAQAEAKIQAMPRPGSPGPKTQQNREKELKEALARTEAELAKAKLRPLPEDMQAAQSRERKLTEALAQAEARLTKASSMPSPQQQQQQQQLQQQHLQLQQELANQQGREKELMEALSRTEAELARAKLRPRPEELQASQSRERKLAEALAESQRTSQQHGEEWVQAFHFHEELEGYRIREKELNAALARAEAALAKQIAESPRQGPVQSLSEPPSRAPSRLPTQEVPVRVRVEVGPGGVPLDDALFDAARFAELEEECDQLHDELEALDDEIAELRKSSEDEKAILKQQLLRMSSARDQVAKDAVEFFEREGNMLLSIISELMVVRRYSAPSGHGRAAQIQLVAYQVEALLNRLKIVDKKERIGSTSPAHSRPQSSGNPQSRPQSSGNARPSSRPTSAAGLLVGKPKGPGGLPQKVAMYGERPFHGRFPRSASAAQRPQAESSAPRSPSQPKASVLTRPQSASALPRAHTSASIRAIPLADFKGLTDPRADLHKLATLPAN